MPRLVCLAVAALAAVGAVPAQAQQPAPAAPVPAQPAGTPEPAAAAAAPVPTDAAPGFDFGEALRANGEPLTADRAAELAVARAPSVARARSARERARAAASEALVAVYPRLDLEARYTRLSDQEQVPLGTDGIIMNFAPDGTFVGNSDVSQIEIQTPLLDQFLLQARLSYPVSDLFFSILPRYEASKEAARAEELNIKAREASVALAAREAFYDYARARAALLVAESALAQTEAHRRDVEAMVNAGALARVELMRSDALVARARVTMARASGAVALARTQLSALLMLDAEEFAIEEDVTAPLPAVAENRAALVALARQNRSELLALRTMAGVHGRLADASAADGYPKLAVGASYDLGNPNSRFASFEREWNGSWVALATLSWSPNDFAASGARADQSRADETAAHNDLDALEDTLRVEVAGAHEDYLAASAAMEAAQVGIRSAEESYRVRREQFRAGAAVATDVIDAEEDLRRARLDLVNAAIDVRIARARLDRAVERAAR